MKNGLDRLRKLVFDPFSDERVDSFNKFVGRVGKRVVARIVGFDNLVDKSDSGAQHRVQQSVRPVHESRVIRIAQAKHRQIRFGKISFFNFFDKLNSILRKISLTGRGRDDDQKSRNRLGQNSIYSIISTPLAWPRQPVYEKQAHRQVFCLSIYWLRAAKLNAQSFASKI